MYSFCMKTIRVLSRKRCLEHPLLFPGLLLNNRVKKTQYTSQLVGEAFERLSLAVAGKHWHRLQNDVEADVRPDLGTQDNLNFIESKATQHRFRISVPQLEFYKDLVEDNAKLRQNCNIVYFLWTYGGRETRLTENGKTVGGVLNLCQETTVSLDILHWSIMYAMLKKLPEGVTHHSYFSWKASNSRDCYQAMQFGEPFLERLRRNPSSVLQKELGLNPDTYKLQTKLFRRKKNCISFDGVSMNPAYFEVNRYIRNPDYTEFPEHYLSSRTQGKGKVQSKEAIPF